MKLTGPLLAGFIACLAGVIGVVAAVATGNVPSSAEPHLWLSWPILGALLLLLGGLTVWQTRLDAGRSAALPATSSEQPFHVKISREREEKPEGPVPKPPSPYFRPRYPPEENFTGRVDRRRMLTEWLSEGDRPVFALVAMGGMGKSALAWAWLQRDVLGLPLPGQSPDPPQAAEACRVAEGTRPEGVLWWSFYARQAGFATFLDRALSYASGGSVAASDIPSAYEKVMALVDLLQDTRLLLVLDGFERELRAYAGISAAYQGDTVARDDRGDFRACGDPHAGTFLQSLAAGAVGSRVLLTSRLFPRELDDLGGCRQEELTALHPEEAVAFFQAQGIRGTRAEIEAACRPYGYLPLALRLLSGVIKKDKRKPGDVSVTRQHAVLRQLRGKGRHHILQVAYRPLDRRKRTLLNRIAAFRSPMGYDALHIVTPYKTDQEFDDALGELIDRGLLWFDREGRRFDLHPVVRQYAYKRLADKKGTHTRLGDYFAAAPAPEPDAVQSLEDLAPVIELYHHTVGAGHYDEARELFRDRLATPLHFSFGAYQTCIELLGALFPKGEEHPPRLAKESNHAWTLNELAGSYALSGQSRRAVPLVQRANAIPESRGDRRNLAVGLANLATQQTILGELAAAEGNLRRRMQLSQALASDFDQAVGHQEMGRLLAYEGHFPEAQQQLTEAGEVFDRLGPERTNFVSVVRAYRALRALLIGEAKGALEAARRARELADEYAKAQFPVERDFIWAEWLLGAALVALASEEGGGQGDMLAEAEAHLTEALTRCRRINLVELEPDILLAWARWHHAKGNPQEAQSHAREAVAIADRCEYRLKQAEIHNFLARLALDQGDQPGATEHAATAYERAWCDGPPHCYKPALDEAKRLLKELGVEPPRLAVGE